MHITPEGKFVRTDIWREGKWLDLWSVVHMLSGASMAFVLYMTGFSARSAAIIAFLLMVVYEFWEAAVDIEETDYNRFADVVVGMAVFIPVYLWFIPILNAAGDLREVFAVILAVNLIMSVLGWMASRKAAALEAKMRLEYMRGKHYVRERLMRRKNNRKS